MKRRKMAGKSTGSGLRMAEGMDREMDFGIWPK
jgi:hypothetical protein